ncbi:hypothetical protein N7468_009147 [Penicillium chermesinum]|uniref:FR47-like domain-containing protein n=1 Tax=Penicillium chermesinum TaxID=63820 RepID=A0A9W9NHL6_9EURO|nr:uncharacterized protein N7468_009147 [Penicillium chermesinum]KAJ5219943.1 hypothetical protein N7468_009147 [Penicillium chermesinum]KAJ6157402.1 hypothetical protein N7470_004994 [Penicillium chermesinum]
MDLESAPRIYEHDASILADLATELPLSITLLRRIQHGLAYPSPTAKILSTFPPGAPAPSTPWLAARVDLFRGRETQIVLYSSLENSHSKIQPVSPSSSPKPAGPSTSASGPAPHHHDYLVATLDVPQSTKDLARDQLLALLSYVKTHLRPAYLTFLAAQPPALQAAQAGVALIPAPDPRAFLLGSLHTGLYSLLLLSGEFAPSPSSEESQAALPGIKVHRVDNPPYEKYFFPRTCFTPREDGEASGSVPLPAGYRYADRRGRVGVLAEHLDLVQSRTHIPRSREQLSMMPGVAVYKDVDGDGEEEELPIAWAFLGLDGPLATLHVEPEHRGKGLALALSRETMRRGMNAEGPFGAVRSGIVDERVARLVGDWVHTEVAAYNKASKRVMEKIGGEVRSTVMWTVIELLD